MRRTPLLRQAAITLTELLVVLVIIGILSTTALPVYISQAERARQAAAKQECYEIAQAMEACGIEHGRFVPLQVLDDLPGDSSQQPGSNADLIRTEGSGIFTIDYNVPASRLIGGSNSSLTTLSDDPRTVDLLLNWKGPFINFQRFYVPSSITDSRTLNQRDFPLDPWGNPYRFYSPVGIVGSMTIATGATEYQQSDFSGVVTGSDDRFDRWAIVSWGPDGESDTDSTTNFGQDDIAYVFGYAVANETNFNANP